MATAYLFNSEQMNAQYFLPTAQLNIFYSKLIIWYRIEVPYKEK